MNSTKMIDLGPYVKHDGYVHNLQGLIRHLAQQDWRNRVLEIKLWDSNPLQLTAFASIAKHIRDIVGASGIKFYMKDHVPRFTDKEIDVKIWHNETLDYKFIGSTQRDLCIPDSNKLFGAFFGRFELHRMLMAHHLERYHADQSVVVFQPDYSWAESDLMFLKEEYSEQLTWWRNRSDNSNIDSTNQGRVYYEDANKQYHKTFADYAIEIVFETNYTDVGTFSEKISRCLYTGKPFVLYGVQGQLQHLRDLGFRTFQPYIDESYDLESNYEKRFDMITQEVDRLSKDADLRLINKIAQWNKTNFDAIAKQYYEKEIT